MVLSLKTVPTSARSVWSCGGSVVTVTVSLVLPTDELQIDLLRCIGGNLNSGLSTVPKPVADALIS